MAYGERISELRTRLKLTQDELAKRLGITRAALSHYEKDRREPDYATLQKIADFFEVQVDYLLGRTDDPSSSNKQSSDELTTIMYHKWDQLDERRRKQALKLIEILEQEADEENNKD
ncbi:helix-turn-helix transcriptional regulator [Brevibacillus agri]|uniref:helix-turn-helix domain-containing protein n=1 Tax=Brevibacillus agri TaxID=51101 RepID=UPI003D25709E